IRVMPGTAIRQVITIHRGEYNVLQPHEVDGLRHVLRLISIEPAARVARVDGTEPARTRTHGAHQHDGGRARVPALTDVRALRFFATRGETVLAHAALHSRKPLTRRRLRTQPGRLASERGRAAATAGLDAVADCRKALRSEVLFPAACLRKLGHDRDSLE